MKRFFKSYKIIISCFFAVLFFSRCIYVGALMMSVETRTTTGKWKTGNYKTRIQKRAGWAGPYCYYCRVKEKRLGGLYYRKIVNDPFSKGVYSGCTIKFSLHKTDTIAVNVCQQNTSLIKY